MVRMKTAKKNPKTFRRWNNTKRQNCSKLRKLIRCVAFLPLFYLLLERVLLFPFEDSNLSGYLDVERIAVTSTIKKKEEKENPTVVVLPYTTTPGKRRESLEALTQPFRVTDTSPARCSAKSIAGYHHLGVATSPEVESKASNNLRRKIPKVLHQQGTSRCVSSNLHALNEEWEKHLLTNSDDGVEWSIFFHTEDAMTRLFRVIVAAHGEEKNSKHSSFSRIGKEFPHLGQILRNCVDNGSFSKRLLWRFLCLYIYGGMYVDLEYILPLTYDDNAKTILRYSNDTVLLWAATEGSLQEIDQVENHISHAEVGINPHIIAVSPGHPLIYYAVQHVLMQIITDGYLKEDADNKFSKSIQNSVVSNVLKRALADFLQDHNLESNSVHSDKHSNNNLEKVSRNKTYYGTGNASVTILDTSHLFETTQTASDVKLMKRKKASSIGRGELGGNIRTGLDKSQGKPLTCLRKSLADVLTTT